MKRRDIVAALIGAMAAIVLAGGVAWAAIPGDGGVIQGCYDSGGNLKVVAALPCPKGYTLLQWNQQGPKGDAGPQGETGPKGDPGAPGATGVDGSSGVSVTSESEPPGTNCANGGTKFTAANGVTYACNGGSEGGSALTGHQIVTAAGSGTCNGNTAWGTCNSYGAAVATATCPAGKVATGGIGGGASGPVGDNAWRASAGGGAFDPGNPPSPPTVSATVICFDAG